MAGYQLLGYTYHATCLKILLENIQPKMRIIFRTKWNGFGRVEETGAPQVWSGGDLHNTGGPELSTGTASFPPAVKGGGGESLNPGSSSLRIILVGKTGSGRSATGNSILCQPVFESKLGAQPVTRKCQRATGVWNGRTILVVDTPPIFEAEAQDQEVYENIGACYLLLAPGPHVLLLVTQLGRFTEQDVVAVTRVKEVFGAGAERYMVIIFTHKEDLEGGSLDEYVANTDNLRLRSLVRECGRRYCAFNNRASGDEQREQLVQLMAVIKGLEQERQGAFLTNELFFDAQRLQRGGGDAHGEDHSYYLAKVQLQVAKQKQSLKEAKRNWAFKTVFRLKAWIVVNYELCVCLVWCSLLFLLILLIILYHL